MSDWDISAYQDIVDTMQARRQDLLAEAERLVAHLPLKYLRQQAQFTTPASNYDMLLKAVEGGQKATPKILDKFGISIRELADTIEVPESVIEETLAAPDPRAPFVMVDGEDAQALRDDVVARGRLNAVKIFREANWAHTLRFYRPSGLSLDYCIEDLVIVLTQAAKDKDPADFPIDGIVWPKVEHPEQIRMVSDLLGELEHRLGLPENRIKMEFLVESGWAASQLPLIVREVMPRIAGIIWGIADYSADINLPHIINDHPVCDWVRMVIINMAGALGVPAIDNMTVNYPVADKSLDEKANHDHILARLKEVYDDAAHGQALGMGGKWVGHPAQLFMVRLAYRVALPENEIAQEVSKIEAYVKAVEAEQGATIIDGVMSDRATDRHARNKLRTAIAIGHLDANKGIELGLITKDEAAELGL